MMMKKALLLLSVAMIAVASARSISLGSQKLHLKLSEEEKEMLDQVKVKEQERRAKVPVQRSSPSSAEMLNRHLKIEEEEYIDDVDGGDGDVKKRSDLLWPIDQIKGDGHTPHVLTHCAANSKLPVNTGAIVQYRNGHYTHGRATWEPRSVIHIHVNWNHSSKLCDMSAEDLQSSFEYAANLWKTAGPNVPTFEFHTHSKTGVPSSYKKKRIRDGLNEFTVLTQMRRRRQKQGPVTLQQENFPLGSVMLWRRDETNRNVEVDGYIAIHDDKGTEIDWHGAAHHERDKYNLRRTLVSLFGHILGLGISNHPEHAMYGLSRPGDTVVTLGKGDLAGMRALYP